jgi:hypothetical protein
MKAFIIAGFLVISMQMIAQEVYDFSTESKPGEVLRECSFLISNKKNESFRLEIDKIWLEASPS